MNETNETRDDVVAVDAKLANLRARIAELGSLLVCFSVGLDSGFLLGVAGEVLGTKAAALTATGPALSERELAEAKAFAARIGVRHELVDAREMEDEGYLANGPDRCFHCKKSLYVTAHAVRERLGIAHVANGTNVDDLGDYRPGLDAAKAAGVVSPMLDVGFTKNDVRSAAKVMGIELWDKPSAACLASRIPYGTPVTAERLQQVARFEDALRDLGFRHVRVRHHERIARIEVATTDISKLASEGVRELVVQAGKASGFTYVTMDLAGYRVGSHNEVLGIRRLPTVS